MGCHKMIKMHNFYIILMMRVGTKAECVTLQNAVNLAGLQYRHLIVNQYINCSERLDLGYVWVFLFFNEFSYTILKTCRITRHHNFVSPLACKAFYYYSSTLLLITLISDFLSFLYTKQASIKLSQTYLTFITLTLKYWLWFYKKMATNSSNI